MVQQIGNIYKGVIPYQPEGTVVGYYIHAADGSGRSANHPYIGAPDPHRFTVVQMLPGLAVTPDTLLFDDVVQAIEGLQVKIFPDGEEDVVIDNINLEEWDEFYWWAEPVVEFPYNLAAGDSLVLTVFVGVPVDNPSTYVQDTMFIQCAGGDHEVLIIVNEDILTQGIGEQQEKPAITAIYPNPFSHMANIEFNMPKAGHAMVYVLDNMGRHVTELANGNFTGGRHHLQWDGRNAVGSVCPAGIYYLVVRSGEMLETARMVKRQ